MIKSTPGAVELPAELCFWKLILYHCLVLCFICSFLFCCFICFISGATSCRAPRGKMLLSRPPKFFLPSPVPYPFPFPSPLSSKLSLPSLSPFPFLPPSPSFFLIPSFPSLSPSLPLEVGPLKSS